MKARTTKNNRLNLATTPINVTKLCSNAVKIEGNILPVVIKSVKKNDVIALETVLVKEFLNNGWLCLKRMRKTAKSKLLQSFSRHSLLESLSENFSLVDIWLTRILASPISGYHDAKTSSGTGCL